ncbi:hypothetical protein ACSBR1_035964 [Camellia fascicularis]
MNVQVHMSGQISGQVPNQAGTQLPGLPPQNGSSLSNHIQNLAGQRNTLNMEPELVKARRFMQEKIYDFLMQRQQRTNDIPPKRVLDIVRHLDEGLFRNAATKEEYVNLETLENRLRVVIESLPMRTHNQKYPHLVNAPSPIGTMIPTPGMPHSGNSSMMVATAVDTPMIATGGGNSMPSVAVNTGSLLPTANGSSVGIHGGPFNSQAPADFLHEQNIQEEFHQRIAVQDEAQLSRIFKRHSIRE